MPAPHGLFTDNIALEIRRGVSVVEQEEMMTILELDRQRFSISAIAARLNMDRKTIRIRGEIEKRTVYNAKLVAFAPHLNFAPRAQGSSRQDQR
jgi:IS30 family transposase